MSGDIVDRIVLAACIPEENTCHIDDIRPIMPPDKRERVAKLILKECLGAAYEDFYRMEDK